MYNEIVSTGVIVPDTSDVKKDVQDEFKTAFGDDLILDDSTPQGVLITAETAARSNFLQNNAALANQINPNEAGGIFLDAIWALTGGARSPATYSTATVNVTGVNGTLIPEGSIVQNANGDEFASTGVITIASDGTGSGTFKCTEPGPIEALAGTLTQIVNGVLGWETATNPTDATLGAFTQSDASARTLRNSTLALQGSMLSEGIISAVNTITRQSMSFRENIEPTPQTIDGIAMAANSIYCCVAGGTDTEVAMAIMSKKSGGCQYTNGASSSPKSVTLVDPYSGQSNVVKFDRPNAKLVIIQVNVSASSATVNPTEAIKDIILQYADGEIEGEPGFAVGKNVSPFELAGAINQQLPTVYIKSVLVAFTGGTPQPVELVLELWEQAYTDISSISVNLI